MFLEKGCITHQLLKIFPKTFNAVKDLCCAMQGPVIFKRVNFENKCDTLELR